MTKIYSSRRVTSGEYTLTPEEYEALSALPEFQKALDTIRRRNAWKAEKKAAEREARKNPDGTWKHDKPGMNPLREDGLYGKAAQAADGDWYSSH